MQWLSIGAMLIPSVLWTRNSATSSVGYSPTLLYISYLIDECGFSVLIF